MKVGDYVRTKRGTLDRFITSHKQDNLTWYTFEDRGNITNPEYYVVKSRPRIIELIQAGDYVNGYIVKDILDNGPNGLVVQTAIDFLYEKDIKSVVTKEGFESMEYKIGE